MDEHVIDGSLYEVCYGKLWMATLCVWKPNNWIVYVVWPMPVGTSEILITNFENTQS